MKSLNREADAFEALLRAAVPAVARIVGCEDVKVERLDDAAR
jgi:hypothetical protein